MIGIYMLTSPSGKHYIGQSTNIEKRLKSYKRLNCKRQTALYNSLLKYGYDQFKITILEECNEDLLNELEIKYINEYNTLTPAGYNLKSGGKVCKFTDTAKKNCRRGYIKTWKSLIDTYNEPLILVNENLKFINYYKNLEEASLNTGEDPSDIYYKSFTLHKRTDKNWLLINATSIDNVFGNVDCKLIKIYKHYYGEEIENIMEKLLIHVKSIKDE